VKKLLGKNDIEDALKKLDTLTTEEARMAIVETLKLTNRVDDTVNRMDDTVNRVDDKVDRVDEKVDKVDDKVTVLIDGGKNAFLSLFTRSITWIWTDVKKTHAVIHRTVDEEKRSYSGLTPVASRAYLSLQKTSYERNYKTGSLPRILPQITISHARPTTREPHPGFFKAVFSSSGSYLLLSCGSMANVRPFCSPLLHTPLTPIFLAGSGKSVLWYVFPVIVAYVHSDYRLALG
jgi:hypothetical protein